MINNKELLQMLSVFFLKNDVETLYAIAQSKTRNNPIITLGLLQYFSLFCYEYDALLSKREIEGHIKNDSAIKLRDERNSIKLFIERYGKTRNRIIEIDSVQDAHFKDLTKNVDQIRNAEYYNLGVFFDENDNIIGNTQYWAYSMSNKKNPLAFFKPDNNKLFGYEIGVAINSVKKGLESFLPDYCVSINDYDNRLFYKDYNTNLPFATVQGIESYNKELSLRILHLLSALGFMKNIICRIVPSNNLWCIRVKYLIVYSSHISIHILKEKYENLFSWVHSDLWFIKSDFRNCMMHYELYEDGMLYISEEYIDLFKPMFGLVESCFDGKTIGQLNAAIDEEMDYCLEHLRQMFLIDLAGKELF